MKRKPLLIVLALSAVACGGAAPDEDADITEDHQLIGGQPATVERFPATLYIGSNCTAAKVAPKRILTAAHCVYDPSRLEPLYGPTQPISITRTPGRGSVDVAVAAVHVHPKWKTACADSYCAASAVTAKLDAPDIAVIELADDLAEVPIAPVDAAPLRIGNSVTILGFGCTVGVHRREERNVPTLLFANAEIAAPETALHEGSPVRRTDVVVYGGNYLLTGGPASAVSRAGLCPGDSGGPVYAQRGSNLAVVGVNANYTLRPDAADDQGLPVTNWHTRVDAESRNGVAAWLQSVGALDVSGPSSTSRQP